MELAEIYILAEKFLQVQCIKKSENYAVHLAREKKSAKKVIIKILRAAGLYEEEDKNRFLREAEILSTLKHPNIIQIIDHGRYEDYFYISFEYIEGENLRKHIRDKKLTDDQKKKLVEQLFSALAYLHSKKIIHRDIKPENILISNTFDLKLTDFGLAFPFEDTLESLQNSIVGTPCYMSPEQIQGKKLNLQSDLFSAGSLLYELYTGKNLFLSRDFNKTINNIINFDESRLESELKKISPEIAPVLKGLLQKNLDLRFHDAASVLDILSGKKYKIPLTIRNRKVRAFSITLVILISLFLFLYMFSGYKTTPPENNNSLTEPDTSANKIPMPVITDNGSQESLKKEEKKVEKGGEKITEEKRPPVNQLTKIENSEESEVPIPEFTPQGLLTIKSFPWCNVYINDQPAGATPFENPLELESGSYRLRFEHPSYPPLEKDFFMEGLSNDTLNINFTSEFSFLDCRVYPWGKIYINDKFAGQTPLEKLPAVLPGEYNLKIVNPSYKDFSDTLSFSAGDTIRMHYNFARQSLMAY